MIPPAQARKLSHLERVRNRYWAAARDAQERAIQTRDEYNDYVAAHPPPPESHRLKRSGWTVAEESPARVAQLAKLAELKRRSVEAQAEAQRLISRHGAALAVYNACRTHLGIDGRTMLAMAKAV